MRISDWSSDACSSDLGDIDRQFLDFEDPAQFRFSGAVTSRMPSPSRLIDSTRANRAVPGMPITQGSKNMKPFPSEIIRPQDGSGGCTPRPRKDSAASSRKIGRAHV